MREQVEPTIPTLYLRYEDMVLNPRPVLNELFCFLLDVPSIEGTVVEKRIEQACTQGSEGARVYHLKARPKTNLSRNLGMYTND